MRYTILTVPISNYLKRLRQHVGHALLLMPGVAAIVRNEVGEILGKPPNLC